MSKNPLHSLMLNCSCSLYQRPIKPKSISEKSLMLQGQHQQNLTVDLVLALFSLVGMTEPGVTCEASNAETIILLAFSTALILASKIYGLWFREHW